MRRKAGERKTIKEAEMLFPNIYPIAEGLVYKATDKEISRVSEWFIKNKIKIVWTDRTSTKV